MKEVCGSHGTYKMHTELLLESMTGQTKTTLQTYVQMGG